MSNLTPHMTSKTANGSLLSARASLGRFAYIYATIFLVLPLSLAIILWPWIDYWWARQFEAPKLQETFGFEVQYRPVRVESLNPHVAGVVSRVIPGGLFDRLGVRVGDGIMRMHHGEAQFWGALRFAADGYRSSIRVLPPDRFEAGGEG
jgi:hypothetical protein